MPAVSKSAVWNNAWRTIWDLINADKSGYSVAISSLVSSYPDISITTKSDYPIVVVEPVESVGEDKNSLDSRTLALSVTISVQTTSLASLDDLCADISNTIESSEKTLKDNSIFNIGISGTSFSFYEHGKIKVYERSMTYSFVTDYAVS